jgi:hypothetical protein
MSTDTLKADLDALAAQVSKESEDWALRRVYADLLEEIGWSVRANGQRWQAREKKTPLYSHSTETWDWWRVRTHVRDKYLLDPKDLPSTVWDRLAGMTTKPNPVLWKEWYTREAAEAALAVVLHMLDIRVRGDEGSNT